MYEIEFKFSIFLDFRRKRFLKNYLDLEDGVSGVKKDGLFELVLSGWLGG